MVSSIEYRGNLLPVELAVYDSDGQKGLSVPSSLEQEAAKEALANIGGGLGTSISFAQSAGQQIAMDLTRGVMPVSYTHLDFNVDNFLTTLRQYYKGGRFDFLLNSRENIDLLHKRFIVFEIDSIKDNAELFPVVVIIIMEAFINKMRRLKGIRKLLIVEEAWKALTTENMANYLKYMCAPVKVAS